MATTAQNWTGFEPTGYEIDWTILTEMRVVELREGNQQVSTTVGAVLREALPHLFNQINDDGSPDLTPARQTCETDEASTGGLTIKTPRRTIRLHTLGNDSSFAAQMIAVMIKIDRSTEHGGFYPIFFYYDSDHVVDDVHDSFSFFVVNGDSFALDRVTFSRHSGSGFNASVFRPFYRVENQVWRSEPDVEQAKVRWWYRRFYQETEAGRLTTLRDDVALYHYIPEWKRREVIAARIESVDRRLNDLRRVLMFIAIVLVLIAFLLWK